MGCQTYSLWAASSPCEQLALTFFLLQGSINSPIQNKAVRYVHAYCTVLFSQEWWSWLPMQRSFLVPALFLSANTVEQMTYQSLNWIVSLDVCSFVVGRCILFMYTAVLCMVKYYDVPPTLQTFCFLFRWWGACQPHGSEAEFAPSCNMWVLERKIPTHYAIVQVALPKLTAVGSPLWVKRMLP